MFERFTEQSIKVIMLAQEEARLLQHNYVGTDFILLGLIGVGAGIASKALKSSGVILKDARIEVEKKVGRGSGFLAVEIPFTKQAKRLMEKSWEAANEIGHNYIGTEHLLLGLIIAGDDGAAGDEALGVLSTLGVNINKLSTLTREEAKKGSPAAERKREPVMGKVIELSSSDDLGQALENAHDAVWHAKNIAIRAQEFELAAWLRETEVELSERTEKHSTKVTTTESREALHEIFERFTESAQTVHSLAQEESRRLGHNFIGTEQILIGLIGQGSSNAAKTLKGMGVKATEARTEVEKIIGRGSGYFSRELKLTPRAEKLVGIAQHEAKRLGNYYIAPEHLLLALVIEGEGIAARVLENLGCRLSDVRKQMLEVLEEKGPATS